MNMPILPLGLACVTAATRRAGHDAALVDLMFEADPMSAVRDSIGDLCPEVIGISVRNIDDQVMESPQFLLPRSEKSWRLADACPAPPSSLAKLGTASSPRAHCATSAQIWESGVKGKQPFPPCWSAWRGELRSPDYPASTFQASRPLAGAL